MVIIVQPRLSKIFAPLEIIAHLVHILKNHVLLVIIVQILLLRYNVLLEVIVLLVQFCKRPVLLVIIVQLLQVKLHVQQILTNQTLEQQIQVRVYLALLEVTNLIVDQLTVLLIIQPCYRLEVQQVRCQL